MAKKRKMTLMGTNSLGQIPADSIHPMWGALISGGVGTATTIGVRTMSKLDKHAELIGLGAGLASGMAMMVSPKTRAAGFAGVVTALVTQGMRVAEAMLSEKQQFKDQAGASMPEGLSGFGIVTAENRTGLGAVSAERRAALGAVSAERRAALGAGLGAVSAESRQMAGAGLGVVSPEVTRSLGSGIQGARLPVFQGGNLGGHYGATIFG